MLQIGTALTYIRRLSVCDGGLYTCIATAPGGRMENRNFTLFIGCKTELIHTLNLCTCIEYGQKYALNELLILGLLCFTHSLYTSSQSAQTDKQGIHMGSNRLGVLGL